MRNRLAHHFVTDHRCPVGGAVNDGFPEMVCDLGMTATGSVAERLLSTYSILKADGLLPANKGMQLR